MRWLQKIVKKSRKGQSKGQNAEKSPETLGISGLFMAAGEGFEPSQTESESGVLPLHKSAKGKEYYTAFSAFVNRKIDDSKKLIRERQKRSQKTSLL